jgi:hypothetical protein
MPYRLSVAAGLFTNLFWLVIKTHERHMRETTRLQKSAVKRRLIDEGRCDGRLTAKSPEKKTFTPEKKRGEKKITENRLPVQHARQPVEGRRRRREQS